MLRMPTPNTCLGRLVAGLAGCAALFATANPGPTGAPACFEASRGDDPAAMRTACLPGREAGNLIDGFNLAVGLLSHDPEASRGHLRWAADGGLPEAAHVYGNQLIDDGQTDRGLAQLAAAAEAGLVTAQYDYATALTELHGPKRRDDILYWYARAAANGEQSARYNLGVLHFEGHLDRRDPALAWAWFSSLEALEGHPEVYRLVNRLAREMSRDERQRAERLRRIVTTDPMALFNGQ